MQRLIVVGTESDNPFAIDIGRFCGQAEDIADVISLKSFANSEFCPRFITDRGGSPGHWLDGRRVVIVSTNSAWLARDELAMRTLLVARAARDNGAAQVTLVEPDLFYSAQDRGPREDQGVVDFERSSEDHAKFDGQPFSARLYAEMLSLAGVDSVVTLHNHSSSVGRELAARLGDGYHNLSPAPVFAHYVTNSDVVETGDEGESLVVCAPDDGALPFAREIGGLLDLPGHRLLIFRKKRSGERAVESQVAANSQIGIDDIRGKDVLIVDDMVRTGGTIMECCRLLRQGGPRRVVFALTHFYSSEESRESLNQHFLDEIITTNSLPTILNRDMQGRLRRKMVVLKMERFIARFLAELQGESAPAGDQLYAADMSSKNPRWRPPTHP